LFQAAITADEYFWHCYLFSRPHPPATTPASSSPPLLIPFTNESNTKELGCMTLVTSTTARGSLLYKTEQHHSFLRGREKKKPKEEVKEGKNNQKPKKKKKKPKKKIKKGKKNQKPKKKKKKLRTFLQKLHKNLLRILSRRRLRSLCLSFSLTSRSSSCALLCVRLWVLFSACSSAVVAERRVGARRQNRS